MSFKKDFENVVLGTTLRMFDLHFAILHLECNKSIVCGVILSGVILASFYPRLFIQVGRNIIAFFFWGGGPYRLC